MHTKKRTEKKTRSQVALEFLTTYGWAVLIIVVVIGALIYLGIFDSSLFAASCSIPPGFHCAEFKIDGDSGVDVVLQNKFGKSISEVQVMNSYSREIKSLNGYTVVLTNGTVVTNLYSCWNTTSSIQCQDESGNPVHFIMPDVLRHGASGSVNCNVNSSRVYSSDQPITIHCNTTITELINERVKIDFEIGYKFVQGTFRQSAKFSVDGPVQ